MDGFFQLEIAGLDPTSLRMQAFRCDEALSTTYRVTVDAVAKGVLDVPPLLGASATLRATLPHLERNFHGIVWRVVQHPVAVDRVHLQFVLAPRLSPLSLGRDNRHWQDRTLSEVVNDVLHRAHYPSAGIEWLLQTPNVHANITQRDESDLAFIERVLAKAGIGYLLQNDFDEERLVFFDDARQLLPVEGVETLVNREARRFGIDTAFDLRHEVRARTAAVILRDYDITQPTPCPEDSRGEAGAPELYLHGADQFPETRSAQRTLERLRQTGEIITGGSYTITLEPGRRIHLDHEHREALTREVLITSVSHQGRMSGEGVEYANRFEAIPVEVPYRPRAPRPRQRAGVQRAFVAGPTGAELHADNLGRVRVKHAWDRSDAADDRSSSWLRVNQLPMPGSMMVPRVGFEVKVTTEQSDIDRPLVTGHLYNQEQPPSYGGQATVSSIQTATTDGGPGTNELRIDDTAGAETILFNASYDLTCGVGHDATWSVGNNETVEIGANHTLTVTGDATATVGATRSLDVGGDALLTFNSDYSEGVGGDVSETIGGARLQTIGGDRIESVTGSWTRTVGAADLVAGVIGVKRKIVGDSQATVGAAWVELISDNRISDVGKGREETVGALKWVRAKNKLVAVGKDLAETVGSQTVNTGAVRSDSAGKDLTIEVKDTSKLKAENFNFTASDSITLKLGGCVIELKKNGAITVKGDKITLKNAKELAQLLYKGN